VLAELDDGSYERLETTAQRLAGGLREALPDAQVTRVGTLVGVGFAPQAVTDADGAHAADHDAYAALFHRLLAGGVYVAPSGYEAAFPSLAHTDADIDRTVELAAGSSA
jgi:glutamate-1-semialdehyde 2,1-aminomutase